MLNLSPVSNGDASFGITLSGSGRYTNDAAVALVSLILDGSSVARGTYTHADFTPAQQAFLVKTTGVITVTGTAIENWRFDHFGSTVETTISANNADPNDDGETNLLEFATGQNPQANTRAAASLTSDLKFIYVRSVAAHSSGIAYVVQWSDTLAADSWSSVGVSEEIIATAGNQETVRAVLPGQAGTRFARLRVVSVAPGGGG
ncbi:MAG: hypothetical protein RLZZ214_2235 [Verrucomicrobiota bacterium]